MTRENAHRRCGGCRGFTLLELLLASIVFAIVISALHGVFFGALRLRDNTYEAVESGLSDAYVAGLIRRDIKNLAPPTGVLAGAMIGEEEEENGVRLDALEFFTTTGIVRDSELEPWGEVQKVEYYLAEPLDGSDSEGADFVRAVTRNLLASTEEEPAEERLLHGAASLEFAYFDGEDWQESWDSTTVENETPEAMRMRLDFMPPEQGERVRRPSEIVCELVVKPMQTEDESEAAGP